MKTWNIVIEITVGKEADQYNWKIKDGKSNIKLALPEALCDKIEWTSIIENLLAQAFRNHAQENTPDPEPEEEITNENSN